ncbi:MAG: type II toxin-antitoxin system Phd/YefM family antitoxin [Deltaproteobacteria bacterium]|nr:type II toxin-antitoxin system Phd/YefM family antitoxin [Deltaproteobacteria bacterium]
MEKVNALKVRQAFGRILKNLQKKNEPIMIEKGRNEVAVLIPIKAFRERFIDYQEKEKREQILKQARESATKAGQDSLKVLRALRYD